MKGLRLEKTVVAAALIIVAIGFAGAPALSQKLVVPFYSDSGSFASRAGLVTLVTLSNPTGATQTITLQYFDLAGNDVTPNVNTFALPPGVTTWRPYYDAVNATLGTAEGENIHGWQVPDAKPGSPDDYAKWGTIVIDVPSDVTGMVRLLDFSLVGAMSGGIDNAVSP